MALVMHRVLLRGVVVFLAWHGVAHASQDIEIIELERTPTYSVHQVRVYTREQPHLHAFHDSEVAIESGGGTLYLNGRAVPLKPGDHIAIPRNVPHYFVHQTTAPFTQARVVFTPPFDGKDRVPVKSSWRTRIARGMEIFFSIVTFSFTF